MPFLDNALSSTIDTLRASAAATASGSTAGSTGYGTARAMVAQLEVTAVAGTTPTLDVVIEDSVDGTNWNVVATFPQATGVSRSVQRVNTPFTDRLRVRHTVAGTTPSFTFSVKAYFETAQS